MIKVEVRENGFSRLLGFLLLLTSASWFGCCTSESRAVTSIRNGRDSIELPIRFAGYNDFYQFVAQREDLAPPDDADTLFKLAADSSTEIITVEDKALPYVYVVTSHLYDGGIYDRIRGVQGNGWFYILRPPRDSTTASNPGRGFELVGHIWGNSCELTYRHGKPCFVSRAHVSAAEAPTRIHEWNGTIFEPVD